MENANLWKTLHAMLKRRGYQQTTMDPSQQQSIVFDADHKPVLVMFSDDYGVSTVRSAVATVKSHGGDTVILITEQKLTHPAVKDVINAMINENIYITCFTKQQLGFDIASHVLVPMHKRLSPNERLSVLKRLGMTNTNQLRKILLTDPMCQYMGGRPGDVFEIRRITPTVGEDITYRAVTV